MNDSAQYPHQSRRDQQVARIEATIHPGRRLEFEGLIDLDLDHIPDPEGGIRVLVSPDEAVELVERGYEVRLLATVPVKPLDAALVMDDDSARSWLEEKVEGIERTG